MYTRLSRAHIPHIPHRIALCTWPIHVTYYAVHELNDQYLY